MNSGRKTRYVILGMLANEGPLSGYAIKKLVDIRCGFFWSESFGQLYPELERLADEGLVERCAPEEGEREKRFRILPAGRAELSTWLANPDETETWRVEFLLKFFFGAHGNADDMLRMIDRYAETAASRKRLMEGFQDELAPLRGHSPDHEWTLDVIDLGIGMNETWLAWCEKVRKRIAES